MSAMMAVVAVATGTAGAAIAYVSAAPGSTADTAIVSKPPAPQAQVEQSPPRLKVRVRLRPCTGGARLEHGTCVRHVVHTVVQPAAPSVASIPAAQPSTSTSPRSGGGQQGGNRPGKADAPGPSHEQSQEPGHDETTEPAEPADGGSDDVPGVDD